jgi:hypothetical protein
MQQILDITALKRGDRLYAVAPTNIRATPSMQGKVLKVVQGSPGQIATKEPVAGSPAITSGDWIQLRYIVSQSTKGSATSITRGTGWIHRSTVVLATSQAGAEGKGGSGTGTGGKPEPGLLPGPFGFGLDLGKYAMWLLLALGAGALIGNQRDKKQK